MAEVVLPELVAVLLAALGRKLRLDTGTSVKPGLRA
jgi:hypothetical protein